MDGWYPLLQELTLWPVLALKTHNGRAIAGLSHPSVLCPLVFLSMGGKLNLDCCLSDFCLLAYRVSQISANDMRYTGSVPNTLLITKNKAVTPGTKLQFVCWKHFLLLSIADTTREKQLKYTKYK